jgi:hypothetical protein
MRKSISRQQDRGQEAMHDGRAHLARQLSDGARVVVEEDGGVPIGGAHILEHVKVLGDHLRSQDMFLVCKGTAMSHSDE